LLSLSKGLQLAPTVVRFILRQAQDERDEGWQGGGSALRGNDEVSLQPAALTFTFPPLRGGAGYMR
jgi:hypothetical protein